MPATINIISAMLRADMRIPEYSETLDSNGTHTPEKCRRADDATVALADIGISNDPVPIDENWYV